MIKRLARYILRKELNEQTRILYLYREAWSQLIKNPPDHIEFIEDSIYLIDSDDKVVILGDNTLVESARLSKNARILVSPEAENVVIRFVSAEA